MEMRGTMSVLLAGVGGQGVLRAAEVLARAAIVAGLDAKKSEMHGLAMRGGAVQSHVRFGRRVHSPLIPEAEADVVLALEELEALRQAPMARRGGVVLLNRHRISPAPVTAGRASYPDGVVARLEGDGLRVVDVPASTLASRAGKGRSENFVLLGVLSRLLPIPPAAWRLALTATLPLSPGDVNLRAFALGLMHGRGIEPVAAPTTTLDTPRREKEIAG